MSSEWTPPGWNGKPLRGMGMALEPEPGDVLRVFQYSDGRHCVLCLELTEGDSGTRYRYFLDDDGSALRLKFGRLASRLEVERG